MSMNTGRPSSGTQLSEQAAGVAQTAKLEATQWASSAGDSAKHLAAEATTQAKAVAQQAKEQVANIVDQTRHEVQQTAQHKAEQAATGLRTIADQLGSLANGQPNQAGQLQRYVQDAQERVSSFATRLENDGPQAVLSDVTRFARQRPAVFLMMAAGAGFAIGRLARAAAATASDHGAGNAQAQLESNGVYSLDREPTVVTSEIGVLPADRWPTSDLASTPVWAGETAGNGSVGEEF
jgi:hypothetical protein